VIFPRCLPLKSSSLVAATACVSGWPPRITMRIARVPRHCLCCSACSPLFRIWRDPPACALDFRSIAERKIIEFTAPKPLSLRGPFSAPRNATCGPISVSFYAAAEERARLCWLHVEGFVGLVVGRRPPTPRVSRHGRCASRHVPTRFPSWAVPDVVGRNQLRRTRVSVQVACDPSYLHCFARLIAPYLVARAWRARASVESTHFPWLNRNLFIEGLSGGRDPRSTGLSDCVTRPISNRPSLDPQFNVDTRLKLSANCESPEPEVLFLFVEAARNRRLLFCPLHRYINPASAMTRCAPPQSAPPPNWQSKPVNRTHVRPHRSDENRPGCHRCRPTQLGSTRWSTRLTTRLQIAEPRRAHSR